MNPSRNTRKLLTITSTKWKRALRRTFRMNQGETNFLNRLVISHPCERKRNCPSIYLGCAWIDWMGKIWYDLGLALRRSLTRSHLPLVYYSPTPSLLPFTYMYHLGDTHLPLSVSFLCSAFTAHITPGVGYIHRACHVLFIMSRYGMMDGLLCVVLFIFACFF